MENDNTTLTANIHLREMWEEHFDQELHLASLDFLHVCFQS